jgi:hypothetical protein
VYADPADIDQITQELENVYNTSTTRQFYPWKEYNSLQQAQQVTILRMNNQFNTDFRSLIITGFNLTAHNNNKMWEDDKTIREITTSDGNRTGKWEFTNTNNDHDMLDDDISDRFYNNINLTTTTVTDFIQCNYLSGDTTPVFAHVYAPLLGTREVLVTIKHIPEALDLIKTIRIELSRAMNTTAIQQTFADADDLISETATTTPWTPFDIQATIPAAMCFHTTRSKYTESRSKRARHSSKPSTITYNSYYDAVTSQPTTEHSHCEHLSITAPTIDSTITYQSQNVDNTTASDNQTHPLNKILADLQKEMTDLKGTITSIDNKIEHYNDAQTKEIKLSEQQCKQRIDTLQTQNQHSMQELSHNFLEQMQIQQTLNNSILVSLLAKQEESILSKLRHPISSIDANPDDSNRSPTRKKPSHTTHSLQQDDISSETCHDILMTAPPTLPAPRTTQIINPYLTNSMRRRSVQHTLPTTSP